MSTTRIELDLTPKEIGQLREAMDALPLNPYGPLIVKVLNALPLESDAGRTGADSSLGKEALSDVMRRLLQTTQTPSFFPRDCSPHGESL